MQPALLFQGVGGGHGRGRNDGTAGGAGVSGADAGGAIDTELLVGDQTVEGHADVVGSATGSGFLGSGVALQCDDLRCLASDQGHLVQCDGQGIAGLFFGDADVAQLGVVDFIQAGTDISAVVFADRGGSGDLVRIGVDGGKLFFVGQAGREEDFGDVGGFSCRGLRFLGHAGFLFVGKLSFVAHNSDMRLKDVRMSQRSCYAATELFS